MVMLKTNCTSAVRAPLVSFSNYVPILRLTKYPVETSYGIFEELLLELFRVSCRVESGQEGLELGPSLVPYCKKIVTNYGWRQSTHLNLLTFGIVVLDVIVE